jgi:hypothetical protein
MNMVLLKSYNRIKDAANELNIIKCCKYKIKTSYGFIWKYCV